MPRKLSSAVHRYFDWDDIAKYSSCKECGNKLKGNHASNLLNHLRLKHEEKYKDVLIINKSIPKDNINKIRKDEEKEKKRKKLLQCCIKLIAIHGRPFSLLDDKAFRDIKTLISADFYEEANSKKVRELITEKAYRIKEKIAAEINKRLISIKMDSATCMERQFIGINVQYVKKSKIVVRNLAIIEIYFSQTAENLKLALLQVLADFQINIVNIYSLTTDNGANYLKMSRLLNEEIDNQNDEENDSEDEQYNYYDNFETGLESFDSSILNENAEQSNVLEIRSLACAVHTLQLCIKDVLKNDYDTVIQKCRSVVRILRRPLMKLKIRENNLKKPILDCTTRWSSTYYMLKRLKELKNICDDTGEICAILNENLWIKIDNMLESLKPSEEATVRLQAEQMTVGDFYSVWIICKTKTEKICLPLAQDLVAAMSEREKTLLTTKAFLMGIFLDPRLKIILSEEEKETAKRWIKDVHRQMQVVQTPVFELNQEEQSASEFTPACSRDTDPINIPPVERYESDLQCLEEILNVTQRVRAPDTIALDLDYFISEYLTSPRLAVSEDTLRYWSSKLPSKLAELALVVLAAPLTQVTVERLFSVLKFILTPSRNRLLDQTLKNIILIKSNEDLFDDDD